MDNIETLIKNIIDNSVKEYIENEEYEEAAEIADFVNSFSEIGKL